jgi:membrane associated rhomboid family serine protease
MLALWIAGSAIAALAHVLLYPSLGTPLLGASGGVAVLLGVAMILRRDVRLPLRLGPVSMAIPLWAVLLTWATLQLYLFIKVSLITDAAPAVAYWSHVAGFGFGALAVLVMNRFFPATPHQALAAEPAFAGD